MDGWRAAQLSTDAATFRRMLPSTTSKPSPSKPSPSKLSPSKLSLLGAMVIALAACSDDETISPAPAACEIEAPEALRACVDAYSAGIAACFDDGGQPCADGDSNLDAALDALESKVSAACGEGLGPLDGAGTVERLAHACSSQAEALSWRAHGGPHGAVWSSVESSDRACLASAHARAAALVTESLVAIGSCVDESCDPSELETERAALEEAATAEIASACSNLASLIAVDAPTFVERAAQQVDCLAAAAHPDPGGVSLRCGPSYAQFDAPAGQWTRVDVDGERWGTLCGDGSPYAFHVRLAPEGQPLDRVVIGLQGGGVCLFADDCEARFESSPGLFTADDDEPPFSGIMDVDPANNPFSDWTLVFLPYCTQDVFAGGGTEEELGEVTVARYGSINMRAAMQMVRDVLWEKMDADGGEGYRPDEVVALFGGWSAGGYGTIYNYHWLLDDLLWPRTSAYPDAGLGIDNGSAFGVKGLGAVKIPAWGMRPNLPPYCFAGDCAAADALFDALSPRLLQVPEQQLLAVSNPLDSTQAGDAFFEDDVSFINALRGTYCSTKDLPGIQWYLTSTSSESVHVVTLRPEHWEGSVDGVVMKDWFERAMSDPSSLEDRAEEADFTTAVPGVMPFPCNVAP